MNLQQQDQFYQWMIRVKGNSSSRAASSKDDVRITEMINGQLISKPVKKVTNIDVVEKQEQEPIIIDLQKSKAGSEVTTTKYYYDMRLPSTGDQVYKCGLHEFETKNLTEFKRHVEDHGSKAASTSMSVPGINNNKLKAIHDFMNGKH
jgi:predicted RNA methylase